MLSPDPPSAVDRAGLRYVDTHEPGLSRSRSGRGFSYREPGGQLLRDRQVLARIRALAIPPAWTEVWICSDADGHIQAVGRDGKGRKQYRYHPEWSRTRGLSKYAELAGFGARLPLLRDRVGVDLSARGLPRHKVIASVVWLLDQTLIRVGNAAYARENGSFGLTTLRQRHLDISGSTLKFAFRGKSGKAWQLAISDRRIARVLRSIQDLPGQSLFQYIDAQGDRVAIASNDVNAYIRDVVGEEYSSKHFRTWGGTVRALHILGCISTEATKTARARILNSALDQVAGRLGNTRAVCRACYVHPAILSHWQEGALHDEVRDLKRKRPRRKGLDDQEALTLRWLDTCVRTGPAQ
ncbi:DNA topoisomerase IB [Pelagibacterium montanilacus]|uniref:DNA topoisomerase IB n=1 Tax=Pelagibacterium montanilacus TaxID=2185280 RepID=UPI000F8E9A2B|nr:DNA topoisomerase IB [Pelagibacterium montanilacus]